ncbi:MAG TPA: hypothetical protein VGP87_11265 [Gemmatimonadales bacterium]|jgi:hypothetical protein|nr:hypothetical protein [Gemmatimonadales bacterium]
MRAALILAVTIAIACGGRSGAPARSRPGTIAMTWTGKSRGSFMAPATARWCPADTLLEILAVRSDTAVGLALLARDSLRAERYVVNESRNFTPGRPQANVALRMLGDITLLGYDAMAGEVLVTQSGAMVSGSLEVRLRPVSGSDTLRMQGAFQRIPVSTAQGACGRANKPGGG